MVAETQEAVATETQETVATETEEAVVTETQESSEQTYVYPLMTETVPVDPEQQTEVGLFSFLCVCCKTLLLNNTRNLDPQMRIKN